MWHFVDLSRLFENVVYECQKQNGWWNKKISGKRIRYMVIGLFIFIPLVIFLLIITKAEILITIFSSCGLILKGIERYCKYKIL